MAKTACNKCKYIDIRDYEGVPIDKIKYHCKGVLPGTNWDPIQEKSVRADWYQCHMINVSGQCKHYVEGEPT